MQAPIRGKLISILYHKYLKLANPKISIKNRIMIPKLMEDSSKYGINVTLINKSSYLNFISGEL